MYYDTSNFERICILQFRAQKKLDFIDGIDKYILNAYCISIGIDQKQTGDSSGFYKVFWNWQNVFDLFVYGKIASLYQSFQDNLMPV